MTQSAFVWYIAWAAIPMVLSILLFWFTKSKATVSTQKTLEDKTENPKNATEPQSIFTKILNNPFGPLGINLTGAAALFFIVFVMMNPIKTGFYEKEATWKLRVDFKDESGTFIPIRRLQKIETIPTSIVYEEYDSKTILVSLNDLREENTKIKTKYSLRVSFEGYEPYTIPLEDSINEKLFCKHNRDAKNIIVPTRYLNKREQQATITPTQEILVQLAEKTIQ